MEDIPDHHEALFFTEWRSRWSRQSPHPPTRTQSQKQRARPRKQQPAGNGMGGVRVNHRGVATGVSEARSHQRRGKKTPTFVTLQKHGRETRSTNLALHVFRSAEAFWNVVKRSVPWSCRTEPKTPWGVPRCESGESEPGAHEVRVHAVRLDGRNRLDALRVFSAGRSQGLLANKRGR